MGYPVWYSAQVVLFLTCNHVQCINATDLSNYYSPSIFSCSLVLSLFIYYLIDQSTLILSLLTSLFVHHRVVRSWIIFLRYLFLTSVSSLHFLFLSFNDWVQQENQYPMCSLSPYLIIPSQSPHCLLLSFFLSLSSPHPSYCHVSFFHKSLPWMEMSRYIIDISGVGPSQHDINK